MAPPFLRDLARLSFPGRNGEGIFAMLEFHFDDSGTHRRSRMVVWGGVVGHAAFFDDFEGAWKKQLQQPCEGRPPIKLFHSAELEAGWGEFRDYSQAEKDLTRRNFRQVILESQLTVLLFGVAARDWEDIIRERARAILGDAERYAFGLAVREGCEAAKKHETPLSFQFDKGRDSGKLSSIVEHAIYVTDLNPDLVSYGFSPVAQNMGLQAADLVAHEVYMYLNQYIDDSTTRPRLHLQRLYEGAHDFRVGLLGRQEIQDAANELMPIIEKLGSDGEGSGE